MSPLEAILLGIVQGITEFLPISSSGHLELGTALFGLQDSDNLLFSVIVHGATALSTIIVFRQDVLSLFTGLLAFKWNYATRFSLYILVSMIPVGIVGLSFEKEIEGLFGGNVVLVGFMLFITGMLLTFTYYAKAKDENITFFKAFIIGIAQSLAIMPGISRSGATIASALLMRVNREEATKFSFLMVLIPIIGASALQLNRYLETPAIEHRIDSIPLILGFLAAFISGLFACKWMVKLVKKGKLYLFAIYCFIVGTIAIIVSL